jgi:hypothetical protein
MYDDTLDIEISSAYNVDEFITALKAELEEELESLEFDANNTLPDLDPSLTFERIAIVKEIMARLNLNIDN